MWHARTPAWRRRVRNGGWRVAKWVYKGDLKVGVVADSGYLVRERPARRSWRDRGTLFSKPCESCGRDFRYNWLDSPQDRVCGDCYRPPSAAEMRAWIDECLADVAESAQ